MLQTMVGIAGKNFYENKHGRILILFLFLPLQFFLQRSPYGGSMGGSSLDSGSYSGSYGDDFDNEPPLLEELGVNFNHIIRWAIVNTSSHPTPKVLSSFHARAVKQRQW